MKALFLTEDNPPFRLATSIHNLVSTWPDEVERRNLSDIDNCLVSADYDFAFVCPANGVNCSFETVAKVGHKLAMCWFDCVMLHRNAPFTTPYGHPLTEPLQWWRYADLGVTTLIFDQFCGNFYPNSYGVSTPQDPKIFYFNDSEIIDVSFVGDFLKYNERIEMVQRLQEAGIDVWAGGCTDGWHMTVEEYARIYRQSKICLNFQTEHGQAHRKGTAFEIAACKKFMMATNGFVLDDFFNRCDYASFDANNVVSQIRYYLSHAEERKACAERMYKTYMERHCPEKFWGYVINILHKKPLPQWMISGMRPT